MSISDPNVQIVLIIAAAIVLALAVWFGRGVIVRRGAKGFEFEVKQKPETPKDRNISVGNELEIKNARAGDIAGVKTEGSAPADLPDEIDVLNKGKIEGSTVGDITGVKHGGGKTEKQK